MGYPLLYVYQTLCKYFSLLSVLVSIIMLHVSYELFRWFYHLPSEGLCNELTMYYGMALLNNRFLTRTRCFSIKYNDILGVTGNELDKISYKFLGFTPFPLFYTLFSPPLV